MDGRGKIIWPDGAVYEGEWKDGQKHGRGKYTHVDGTVYDCEWKACQMDAAFTITRNGISWQEVWENGTRLVLPN